MANRREAEKSKARRSSAKGWAESRERGMTSSSVKLPKDAEFFTFKNPGVYLIDVIPYVVGKGNPYCEEDMEHFERTYYVHKGLGLEGKSSYCCRVKTFKEPCYVCAYLAKNKKEMNEQEYKDRKDKTRCLFNIVDVTEKNADKVVKIFDAPFYKGFGEQLADMLNGEDAYDNFYSLTEGLTLKCKVEEQKFPGGKFMAVVRIDAIPRKKQYGEDFIEKAYCLDDLLVCPTNEELRKQLSYVVDGGAEEEEDEEMAPRKEKVSTSRGKREVEEEEDETEEEEEEETPKRKASPTSKKDEDEEEEDAPKRNGRTSTKSKDEDEDEEEDDSELEDDDEEEDEDEEEVSEDEDEDEVPRKKTRK